jgi:hypothetical protein
MEGCDAKQNATFVPHPFIPLPTNIVFRMKRLFSIYMGYFSPFISFMILPLLWTIKWFTVQSFMNGWTSHFYNVTNLCSPIFSEVLFRSQSKTWTFDALSCCSCWGTCLSGSWRWYRIQVKGGFSWGGLVPQKAGVENQQGNRLLVLTGMWMIQLWGFNQCNKGTQVIGNGEWWEWSMIELQFIDVTGDSYGFKT